MDLSNYTPIDYNVLQDQLAVRRKAAGIHDFDLASKINIKSVTTINNAFNKDKQITSDQVLTKIFEALDVDAIVSWINGERRYFISTKN